MAIVGMASDHAGFEMKEALKPLVKSLGYEIKDFGAFSDESMDYPDTAHPLGNAVEKGEVCCGIAICGSGNGICMTLNKHQGVRAALCWDPSSERSQSATTTPTCSAFLDASSAWKLQNRSSRPISKQNSKVAATREG
jgi:Ribose 5-phosphate isomerase RpiB